MRSSCCRGCVPCGCLCPSLEDIDEEASGTSELLSSYEKRSDARSPAAAHLSRSCTDCGCLVLLLTVLCGAAQVGVIALHSGNPERLVHGEDYAGRLCSSSDKPRFHC